MAKYNARAVFLRKDKLGRLELSKAKPGDAQAMVFTLPDEDAGEAGELQELWDTIVSLRLPMLADHVGLPLENRGEFVVAEVQREGKGNHAGESFNHVFGAKQLASHKAVGFSMSVGNFGKPRLMAFLTERQSSVSGRSTTTLQRAGAIQHQGNIKQDSRESAPREVPMTRAIKR